MDDEFRTVLLCAEDDDLELVQIVHLARQSGLELEVVAGVELDDATLTTAQQSMPRGLFVILRSANLSQERARALKSTFERNKTEAQHLLALRLDPDDPQHAVDAIRRRRNQLLGIDSDRPARPSPTPKMPPKPVEAQAAVPEGLGDADNPATGPIMVAEIDEVTLDPRRANRRAEPEPEQEVTVPQAIERLAAREQSRRSPAETSSRGGHRRWMLGLGVVVMMAAGAATAWVTLLGEDSDASDRPTTPGPAVIDRDAPQEDEGDGDGASRDRDSSGRDGPRTSKQPRRHRG